MIHIISKKTTRKEFDKLLPENKAKRKRKVAKLDDYCGILKLKDTPLNIQKKLRNEWK